MAEIMTISELKKRIDEKFYLADSSYSAGLNSALKEIEKFEAGLRELLERIEQHKGLPPLPEEVLKSIRSD